MGRLLEILKEDATLTLTVNGKQYIKYEELVNIYRLLNTIIIESNLIQSKLTGALIGKMLKDMDEKLVSEITKSFNALKRKIKAKAKSSELKLIRKVLYGALFELIETNIAVKIPGFNKSQLIRRFQLKTNKAMLEQATAMIKIGKGLLKTPGLSTTNKNVIKLIIKSINPAEEIDGDDTETVDKPEVSADDEINFNTSVKPEISKDTPLSELTDDELNAIITNKNEKIKEQVAESTAKNDEAVNNQKSVLETGNIASIKDKISTKLNNNGYTPEAVKRVTLVLGNINKTLLELQKNNDKITDKEVNFVSKLASDFIDVSTKDLGSFLKDEKKLETLRVKVETLPYDDNAIHLLLETDDGIDAEDKLKFERIMHIGPKGIESVEHKTFQIPTSAQGKGTAKEIFENGLDLYEAEGVKRIDVQANISMGGYAWFRYGFKPNSIDEVHTESLEAPSISNWLYWVLNDVNDSFLYSKQKDEVRPVLSEHFKKNGANAAFVKDFATEIKADKFHQWLLAIGEQLRNDFKADYPTIESLETINKDITSKFFDVQVGKKKYKIPYKGIFTIQGVKDSTKTAVVPTDFVALNWYGHLDLTNKKQVQLTRDYLNTRKK